MISGTAGRVALLLTVSGLAGLIALLAHSELREGPVAPLQEDEISVEGTRSWGADVLWLDARTAERFAVEHVPNALAFDPSDWEKNLGELFRRWHSGVKIVVYCNAAGCDLSKELAARLRDEAGLPDVYYLRGGWEAWQKQQRRAATQ